MIRRPPRSTLFPTRRSSDLRYTRIALTQKLRRIIDEGSGYSLALEGIRDRKSTRLNSSHSQISYAVFCLKKKKTKRHTPHTQLSVSSRMREHQATHAQ